MFNIILEPNELLEPNSWFVIDYLAESNEEWSQEMLELFTVWPHHEKFFVTIIFHNLFYQSKCLRKLALNCTYYIIYRVICNSSSLITYISWWTKFSTLLINAATNKFYGYFLLDFVQNTQEDLLVVTDIFHKEITLHLPVNSIEGN